MREDPRAHKCPMIRCPRMLPPQRFCCKKHWNKIPLPFRYRVERSFIPGAHIPLDDPSSSYRRYALDAIEIVAKLEGQSVEHMHR